MKELEERLEQLAEQLMIVKDAMDNPDGGLEINYEVDVLKEELIETSELLEYWHYQE